MILWWIWNRLWHTYTHTLYIICLSFRYHCGEDQWVLCGYDAAKIITILSPQHHSFVVFTSSVLQCGFSCLRIRAWFNFAFPLNKGDGLWKEHFLEFQNWIYYHLNEKSDGPSRRTVIDCTVQSFYQLFFFKIQYRLNQSVLCSNFYKCVCECLLYPIVETSSQGL